MEKIIHPESFGFDEPTAQLVPYHSKGMDKEWFTKRAAAGDIVSKFSEFKPKEGHSHIHLIAMGAADSYTVNRNGDLFYKNAHSFKPVEPDWKELQLVNGSTHTKSAETFGTETTCGLGERYKTFETHGDVYKHHKNKKHEGDPVYGSIKCAAYNNDMDRVELLIEVPNKHWEGELQKLARDESVPFSMSSSVPFDLDTYYGHKARNPGQYPVDVVNNLTSMLKSGHVVGLVNENPTFFDISKVNRPADRIAWSLSKAASGETFTPGLAANSDLIRKPDIGVLMDTYPGRPSRRMDIIQKAAEIEKKIALDAKLQDTRAAVKNKPSDESLRKLVNKHNKSAQAFKAFADHGVCLPFESFLKVNLGFDKTEKMASVISDVKSILPKVYTTLQDNPVEVARNPIYDPASVVYDNGCEKVAKDLERELSLDLDAVKHRQIKEAVSGSKPSWPEEKNEIHKSAWPLAEQYAAYQLSFLEDIKRTNPHKFEPMLNLCIAQNTV